LTLSDIRFILNDYKVHIENTEQNTLSNSDLRNTWFLRETPPKNRHKISINENDTLCNISYDNLSRDKILLRHVEKTNRSSHNNQTNSAKRKIETSNTNMRGKQIDPYKPSIPFHKQHNPKMQSNNKMYSAAVNVGKNDVEKRAIKHFLSQMMNSINQT